MQCNFTFYVFVSSSLFFSELVMKIFDYFWKSNSLFSKFCVNCLLMFYFVYCNNCALKDVIEPVNAPACWWPCACLKCVSGRRREEKNFLRCIHVIGLVHNDGSDMKETGYSFSFTSLYYWVQLPPLLEWVFFSCVSGFRLKFPSIALWRKRLQLDSKSDLTTIGLILEFFVGKWILSLTSYLYGLKLARIAQLFFFFDDIIFFNV